MNAGAYGYEIGRNVVEVNCYDLDQKQLIKLDPKSINYSYRKSSNLNNKVILSAILKFEKGNSKEISEKMSEFNKNRKKANLQAYTTLEVCLKTLKIILQGS